MYYCLVRLTIFRFLVLSFKVSYFCPSVVSFYAHCAVAEREILKGKEPYTTVKAIKRVRYISDTLVFFLLKCKVKIQYAFPYAAVSVLSL